MANTTDSLKSFSDKALNALNKTESLLSKPMSIFGNNYVKNIALVILLLYAPSAAPIISPAVEVLLHNYAIKLIYVFVLAYLLSGSIRVSVLTSVVIVLGIFLLKKIGSEHFEGNIKKVVKNEKQIPSEPVINRHELTKSGCDVAGNIEPNSIDNVTEYNAMANHEDALHPEYLKDMKSVETDTTVAGYDESSSLNSDF